MSESSKDAKLPAWGPTAPRARTAGVAGLLALALAATGPAKAATFQSLYSFSGGPDGAAPYGQLAADKSGMLYGTTDTGGAGGGGTVFRFDPASATLTTLYSFTTSGAKGSGPASGVLVDAKGIVYGATESGGTGTCDLGCGTVFKLDPSTGKLTTLVDFQNLAQGARPEGLVLYGGQLYGVTVYGGYIPGVGNPGGGTLFKVDPKTKTFTSLHAFNQPGVPDGVAPTAALVPGPDGRLYGVASSAGPNGSGTLFAIDTLTAAVSVIHAFDYHVDGASPRGKLLMRKGQLLGTTVAGGPTAAGDGVVFSLDPVTGALTNLYSFAGGADALNIQAGVVLGPNGRVYGVTNQGGGSGAGTIFSVKLTSHVHAVLHDFSISDGSAPSGEMLLQGAAKYYGVTSGGNGTIYELVP
jgi:uncharacterized repeat protein (TIGR03803 family)